MTCTFCVAEEPEMLKRCRERFICETCGREQNCCAALPDWPHQTRNECVYCQESRLLPPGWDARLPRSTHIARSKRRRLARGEGVS